MHIFKLQAALHRRCQNVGAVRVVDGVLGRQQFYKPLGRARRALQFAPNLGKCRNGATHHDRIDHELDQPAFGDFACNDILRSHLQKQHNGCKHHENHDGGQRRAGHDPAAGRAVTLLGHLIEFRAA